MRTSIYKCSVGKSQLFSDFKFLSNLPVKLGTESGIKVGNVKKAWKDETGEIFIDAEIGDYTKESSLSGKVFKLVYYDLPIAVLISNKN